VNEDLLSSGISTTIDSREIEEADSEGGVQVGGREGSVTSVAIAEDFSLESSCSSGTLMDWKKSFDGYVSRSLSLQAVVIVVEVLLQ
jgi:hypothetical protein